MYQIQEAQLQLPPPVQDRSVNVLTYLEPETQAPFQIVVNRDVLVGEETCRGQVFSDSPIVKKQAQAV